MLFYSLREKLQSGFILENSYKSYQFVMASTPEAVKEMLVQRSVDYAGGPQTYFFLELTLGRLRCILKARPQNNFWAYKLVNLFCTLLFL